MKRQTKSLLAAAVVVAVLGGGVFYLKFMPKQEELSAENGSLVLVDRLQQDISDIAISNETGSYRVRNQGEGRFSDEEIRDIPQDIDVLAKLVKGATVIKANQLVNENASDLAIYGLESPRSTVQINYSSGEPVELRIGNTAPGDEGIYFSIAQDAKVYLGDTEVLSPFLGGELDLVSKSLGEKAKPIEVSKLTLSGANYPQDIVLESIPTNTTNGAEQQSGADLHRMVQPKQRQADSRYVNALIEQVMNLQAAKVLAVNPTAEQIAAAGLAKPGAILSIQYGDGKTLTLRAAKGEHGEYYVMKDGQPILYQVPTESLPWFDAGLGNFISRRLLVPDLEALAALTVSGEGKSYRFVLKGEADKLSVTCNEQEVDTKAFEDFYKFLSGLSADEAGEEVPKATPVLTVHYEYKESGKKSDELTFQSGDDTENDHLFIDNEGGLLISKGKVQQILENAGEAAQPKQQS